MINDLENFIGREAELDALLEAFQKCTLGKVQLCTVIGQAGIGKTSLLEAFLKKIEALPDTAITAIARCDSHAKANTPYHVLSQLLPSILEARDEDKELQKEIRLGKILKTSGKLLKDFGPELLDKVLPGVGTLVSKGKEIFDAVNDTDVKEDAITKVLASPNDHIEELSLLFSKISEKHPLVLVVDDAHLSDPISISVLTYLLNKYAETKIMIVLGLRPSYYRTGTDEYQTSLEGILKRYKAVQCKLDDLSKEKKRNFISQIVDLAPNNLTVEFKDQLFKRTGGHPFLTREILLSLYEDKKLYIDSDGLIVAQDYIDWNKAPSNVKEALSHRLKNLAPDEQELLRITSAFDGEMFACIASNFLNHPDWETLRVLSRKLNNELAILDETRAFRVGEQLVVGFRFREPLFKEYVYETIGQGEKMYIHNAIVAGYKSIFGKEIDSLSSELAWHLEQCGLLKEAVELHYKAAKSALVVGGLSEVILHVNHGLTRLEGLTADKEREQLELKLLLLKSKALKAKEGWSSVAIDKINARASILAQYCGETEQIEGLLWSEWTTYLVGAKHTEALRTAQQILTNAKSFNNVHSLILGHATVANSMFWLGNIVEANENSIEALDIYTVELGDEMIAKYGLNIIVIAQMFAVWTSYILGNYSALKKFKNLTLEYTKKTHPLSSAIAQTTISWQAHQELDVETTLREATLLKETSEKGGLVSYLGLADIFLGWAIANDTGNYEQGLQQIEKGTKTMKDTSGSVSSTYFIILKSQLLNSLNRGAQLEPDLNRTFAYAEKTNELAYESELWRLRAETLALQNDKQDECINAYLKSLKITQQKKARTFELTLLYKLLSLVKGELKKDIHIRACELVNELKGEDAIALVDEIDHKLKLNHYTC